MNSFVMGMIRGAIVNVATGVVTGMSFLGLGGYFWTRDDADGGTSDWRNPID